jgi:hypothetical protein
MFKRGIIAAAFLVAGCSTGDSPVVPDALFSSSSDPLTVYIWRVDNIGGDPPSQTGYAPWQSCTFVVQAFRNGELVPDSQMRVIWNSSAGADIEEFYHTVPFDGNDHQNINVTVIDNEFRTGSTSVTLPVYTSWNPWAYYCAY